jgi:hypothetical protein
LHGDYLRDLFAYGKQLINDHSVVFFFLTIQLEKDTVKKNMDTIHVFCMLLMLRFKGEKLIAMHKILKIFLLGQPNINGIRSIGVISRSLGTPFDFQTLVDMYITYPSLFVDLLSEWGTFFIFSILCKPASLHGTLIHSHSNESLLCGSKNTHNLFFESFLKSS